jgi:uncharacterized protein YndB with AHSA1/START domain
MAELKRQIPINTTPEKVFAALAPQAGLRSWWTADATADEKPSGKAEFGFDKRQMVFRMMIEKLEPSKRVVWSCHGDHPEWNGTTIIYDDPSCKLSSLQDSHGRYPQPCVGTSGNHSSHVDKSSAIDTDREIRTAAITRLTDVPSISAVCFEVSRLLTPDVSRRATGNSSGSFRRRASNAVPDQGSRAPLWLADRDDGHDAS